MKFPKTVPLKAGVDPAEFEHTLRGVILMKEMFGLDLLSDMLLDHQDLRGLSKKKRIRRKQMKKITERALIGMVLDQLDFKKAVY